MGRAEFDAPFGNPFENPFFKEQILTGQEVRDRTASLAQEIIRDYKAVNPLFLVVRDGALHFGGLLMREIVAAEPGFHPRLTEITVSTSDSDSSLRAPQIIKDIDPRIKIEGEDVLIVEDIRDRGTTLHFLHGELVRRGVASVEDIVLLERAIADRPAEYQSPRYVGFRLVGDGYAIGTGLDDNRAGHNFGRNIPGIALNFPPETEG